MILNAVQGGTVRASGPGTIVGSGQANVSITLPNDGTYSLIATCAGGASAVSQNLTVTLDRALPTITANVRGDVVGQRGQRLLLR